MSSLISINLVLALILCVAVVALGLWLLGQLFPSQEDSTRRLNHPKHMEQKEQ